MATSYTSTGTAVSEGATTTIWTQATLSADLRGTVAGDSNAAGGSVPDRVGNRVVQAAKDLWGNWDWLFRRKKGTLSLVDGDSDKDVPSDFAELDQRWMRDNENTGVPILFTQNVRLWQAKADTFGDSATGAPQLITLVRDTGETSAWDMHFLITPTCNNTYAYDYWYMMSDPWTAGVIINDSTAPIWPPSFHEGWRLRALWKVLRSFGTIERAKEAEADFKDWLDHQLAENNETITTADERIRDAYGDVGQFASQLYPSHGSSVRFQS